MNGRRRLCLLACSRVCVWVFPAAQVWLCVSKNLEVIECPVKEPEAISCGSVINIPPIHGKA